MVDVSEILQQGKDLLVTARDNQNLYKYNLDSFETDMLLQEKRFEKYRLYNDAAAYLSTVSDDNLRLVLDTITELVNSAIKRLFPMDNKHIELEQTLFQDKYPHINLVLRLGDLDVDVELQEGTGFAQTVSLFYILMLIIARGKRRFVFLDEVLHGLHEDVTYIIRDVLEMFAKKGFQVIICEHKIVLSDVVHKVERSAV